ncbi:TPA: hypothetical protein R6W42_000800 [Citrobacter freundii]|uniref:hypothetical protein n=1 Tax=Citrobacter TaxID=544 RepID=UPI000BAE1B4B|nr:MULTISPECIES: hypothetical protein [Citrobacter]EKV0155807.1 hypothetical protein [Citrobacter freundii]MBJ9132994.1 hypothetical protein [Citrobacter freundii]PAX81095.1 hypothetical protein CIK43_03585 [Citrobacter sp. TSA-1]PCQ44988.1 hypothetical protein CQA31_23670 [Citrobacter freundii]QKE19210.1 hypothetical protein HF677_005775 [Citrobacter sp. TSA-1]
MVYDYISYKSLLVAQDALFWSKFSALIGLASVLVTLFAGVVAFRALNQWKLQYNEDKKLKLMDAIIEYNNTLITIPKTLNDDPNHVNRKLIITAFNCLQARCTIYLSANPNEELSENMRKLRERQFEFLAGGVYKSELALYASVMLFMNLK